MAKLRKMAAKARRSLNSEILVQFEHITAGYDATSKMHKHTRQLQMFKQLSGSWQDDRSTEEIIDDIYDSRTPGREIEL